MPVDSTQRRLLITPHSQFCRETLVWLNDMQGAARRPDRVRLTRSGQSIGLERMSGFIDTPTDG